ncbi:MAG: penicillin-binding protein 2, partial [Micrococcales bacterium]|nr:penicillin-binding protein 2 [Micrococcales bacterium]
MKAARSPAVRRTGTRAPVRALQARELAPTNQPPRRPSPLSRWVVRRLEHASTRTPGDRVGEVGGRGRVASMAVVLLVVVAVFTGRLVVVQVVDGPALAAQAREDRMSTITVTGTRGSIVDSTGVVLASSVPRYDISVNQKLI